ncbi:Alpha-1,3-mannosyltransferase-like protein [Cladochytrium tenue]|nr:Alpha-1,3-mannosyltransferase-like protein [Cladochytrium tenue]
MRILFIHPDLGIGGAERLVVDAATQLQSRGHSVQIFTSHHDPAHCFKETRDGTLAVKVYGDWLPRSFFGKGYIVFAILRSLWLALCIMFLENTQESVLFIDQLSVSIPLLRFTRTKILFYCHFPDKLLSSRESLLKKLYRIPIDIVEELTTAMADTIVVNSRFTQGVFTESFNMIKLQPAVLYPGIRVAAYDRQVDSTDTDVQLILSDKKRIVSLNRFERKKSINLAIEAFAIVKSKLSSDRLQLVVGGGYDHRVRENVEYHRELNKLASTLGLTTATVWRNATTAKSPESSHQSSDPTPSEADVLFIPSFTEPQRTYLLKSATACLYTPSREHFGIVPVEAMLARVPVVAADTGGPTESILDGVTGFLRTPDPAEFAGAVMQILGDPAAAARMGATARSRVLSEFTLDVFGQKLEQILDATVNMDNTDARNIHEGIVTLASMAAGTVIAIAMYYFFFRHVF